MRRRYYLPFDAPHLYEPPPVFTSNAMPDMKELYKLSFEMAADYLGSDVFTRDPRRNTDKLRKLQRWLYPRAKSTDESWQPRFRMAPSMILRGEAEMLGVSSPRFAVRAYLHPTDGSFINCRRRPHLVEAIQRRNTNNQFLADELDRIRNGNWVADSLLAVPEDLLTRGFQMLTTELGRAHGEGREVQGVPYVSYMELSGGQCAQGAIFICVTLLNHLVHPICGLAELTMLAHEDSDRNTPSQIPIGGLSSLQIVAIVNQKLDGVHAILQGLIHQSDPGPRFIEIALQSYLASGCPVIALVSASRMFGDHRLHGEANASSVFRDDWLDDEPINRSKAPFQRSTRPRAASEETTEHHAVVLIGWNKDQSKFVIHDPGTRPFIEVSLAQLVEFRSYVTETKKGALTPDDLGPSQFIPLTPDGVLMPLLSVAMGSLHGVPKWKPGLIEIAESLQTAPGESKPIGLHYDVATFRAASSFLLGSLESLLAGDQRTAIDELDQPSGELLAALLGKKLYWWQSLPKAETTGEYSAAVFVWMATIEPTINVESAKVLVVVLAKSASDGTWAIIWSQAQADEDSTV